MVSVKSVERAVNLLKLFSRQETWLGISLIAQKMDMSKSAAHQMATTLVKAGMLKKDPSTKKYCLGLKLFEFAMIQPDIVDIHQKAAGPARYLSRKTAMTSHLALWDGHDVELVHSSSFPQARPVVFGLLGPKLPAHASALGKAILSSLNPEDLAAFLEQAELTQNTPKTITDLEGLKNELTRVRQRGYALENEELVTGGMGLAAPFFKQNGEVCGAVSLFSIPERLKDPAKVDGLSRQVMETASEISSLYGCAPERMNLADRS
ncbi:hypothetical protein X474_02110 [Dethiosulfatarculus sandiegensis]|uniref:IclR family transcriptional regulator n=1 Tax=Dethiosulfatarculus sandiegensis TaxID=1429043 RepID=A0A0D2HZH9_9BACT|nr:hypothetical protein X474_02110 [Dethiosulfatarculus sandiegensis]